MFDQYSNVYILIVNYYDSILRPEANFSRHSKNVPRITKTKFNAGNALINLTNLMSEYLK